MRFLLFFLLINIASKAQQITISGVVRSVSGEPLPYATIQVVGTTQGTVANENGEFHIKIDKKNSTFECRNVGYQSRVIRVENSSMVIVLEQDNFILKEVEIRANAEDPAYEIIRQAKKNRSAYYNAILNYRCNAYLKQTQEILEAPQKVLGENINKYGILDSNNQGIVYLSEAVSTYFYKKPNTYNEVLISSKVAGNSRSASWNSASDFFFDFNKNTISFENFGAGNFVSPLADNTFQYYNFSYLGTQYNANNEAIHHIKVIPKNPFGPVFSGEIQILDKSYRLLATNLNMYGKSGIPFLDSLNLKQQYSTANGAYYVPFNQKMEFYFTIAFGFKIRMKGNYVGVFSNYDINALDDMKWKNDVIRVEKNAMQRDSIYWDSIRPVALSKIESDDYLKKEGLERKWKSKAFKDSLDSKSNRFGLIDILMGYTYRNSFKHWRVNIASPLFAVSYNTVEGIATSLPVRFSKDYGEYHQHQISVSAEGKYVSAMKPHLFFAKTNINWLYNRQRNAFVELNLQNDQQQINTNNSILSSVNTYYTLFSKLNYMKLYKAKSAEIASGSELLNGLTLTVKNKVEQRIALVNNSFYYYFNPNEIFFTSNNPQDTARDQLAFAQHTANILQASVEFTPNQKYTIRNARKIILESTYPTLQLGLRHATYINSINGGGTLLTAGIRYNKGLGILGLAKFNILYQRYISKKNLQFIDFIHQSENETIFLNQRLGAFNLMKYYSASTSAHFFTAHYTQNLGTFFMNKIPFLRKYKLQNILQLNYASDLKLKQYTELGVGISNATNSIKVFAFFNLYDNSDTAHKWGIRLGLPLF